MTNSIDVKATIKSIQLLTKKQGNLSATIRAAYECWLATDNDCNLVALWEAADSAGVLPTVRTLYNRVSKAVQKDMEIDLGALKVENGQLVHAAKRQRKVSDIVQLAKMIDKEGTEKLKAQTAVILAELLEKHNK